MATKKTIIYKMYGSHTEHKGHHEDNVYAYYEVYSSESLSKFMDEAVKEFGKFMAANYPDQHVDAIPTAIVDGKEYYIDSLAWSSSNGKLYGIKEQGLTENRSFGAIRLKNVLKKRIKEGYTLAKFKAAQLKYDRHNKKYAGTFQSNVFTHPQQNRFFPLIGNFY